MRLSPVEQPLELVAQQPHVLREHVYLLQRPVVQVEAEPDEESLVRLRERPSSSGRVKLRGFDRERARRAPARCA